MKPDITSPLHCGQMVYAYAPCVYLDKNENPMVKPHLAAFRVINAHGDDVCILNGNRVEFCKREQVSATPIGKEFP